MEKAEVTQLTSEHKTDIIWHRSPGAVFAHPEKRKGTSKKACLVMRREILFQIEGQKTQESFVDFKFLHEKLGQKPRRSAGQEFLEVTESKF